MLILEPTRELAAQVETAFRDFSRFMDIEIGLVHGGVGYGKQRETLAKFGLKPGDLAQLVLVGNPDHNPRGDFVLRSGRIVEDGREPGQDGERRTRGGVVAGSAVQSTSCRRTAASTSAISKRPSASGSTSVSAIRPRRATTMRTSSDGAATPRTTQAPASGGGSDTGSTVFTGVIAAFLIVAGAYIVGPAPLGPPSFMHRPSAAENPQSPLAHHLLDSTHITAGVLSGVFFYQMKTIIREDMRRRIADIASLAAIAHTAGARLAVTGQMTEVLLSVTVNGPLRGTSPLLVSR